MEKKSLINTLKATKKANAVSSVPSPEPTKFAAKVPHKTFPKTPRALKTVPKSQFTKALHKTLRG